MAHSANKSSQWAQGCWAPQRAALQLRTFTIHENTPEHTAAVTCSRKGDVKSFFQKSRAAALVAADAGRTTVILDDNEDHGAPARQSESPTSIHRPRCALNSPLPPPRKDPILDGSSDELDEVDILPKQVHEAVSSKDRVRNMMRGILTIMQSTVPIAFFSKMSGWGRNSTSGSQDAFFFDDHDSDTSVKEAMEIWGKVFDQYFIKLFEQSPIFAFSFDCADDSLCIMIYILGPDNVALATFFRLLKPSTHDHIGISKCMAEVFDALLPNWRCKLEGIAADGAATNGTAQFMSGRSGGRNVLSWYVKELDRNILGFHCAPHKFQLAVHAGWLKSPWFAELDKMLHEMHNHLKMSTRRTNIQFWAEVQDESYFRDFSMGKARWMAIRSAVNKFTDAYLSVMVHSYELYMNPSHSGQKRIACRWFRHMLKTETRLLSNIAADMLNIVWPTKLALEKNLQITAPPPLVFKCCELLGQYCERLSANIAKVKGVMSGALRKELLEEQCKADKILNNENPIDLEMQLEIRPEGPDLVKRKFNMKPIEDWNTIDEAQKQLKDDIANALENRFSNSLPVLLAYELFEPNFPRPEDKVLRLRAKMLAKHYKFDEEETIAAFIRILSLKQACQSLDNSLKQSKNREALMAAIISDLKLSSPEALTHRVYKVTCALFQVMPGQSAEVEGALSRRSRVLMVLGTETSIELQSLYIQAQMETPQEGSQLLHDLTEKAIGLWLMKERRFSKLAPGRTSKRKVRKDAGSKGKRKYKKRKAPDHFAGKRKSQSKLLLREEMSGDEVNHDDPILHMAIEEVEAEAPAEEED
jgi:hypothetical protein